MKFFASQTGHRHLRRLLALRAFAVVAQGVALAWAYIVLGMRLPWLPMLATVAALAMLDLASIMRLKSPRPVSSRELFAQLSADVIALSILLYHSGGSTNPFISLLLLPLVISAAALPRNYSWAMALATTLIYTALMKFYVPLPHLMSGNMESMHHDMGGMESMGEVQQDGIFNLHVMGMWLGFMLSVVIISWFVVKMAEAMRERDEQLSRSREDTLRNERIVALGTLAAGAAHELGTPLSTMAVVIGELQHEKNLNAEWKESLALLDGQLRNCRRILDKMLSNTQGSAAQTVEQFLDETLDEWRLLRPATNCLQRMEGCPPGEVFLFDQSLRAALLNLLNNAADASPEKIEVDTHCTGKELILAIHDRGAGLTEEDAARAGSAFFTTKQAGRGLGLFLANATLERLGGRVRLYNREGGGATTEVILPLHEGR